MSITSHLQGHETISVPEWAGSKPMKFKGGRKHDNHPRDELDNLLMGASNSQSILGPTKRRIEVGHSVDQEFRPIIKVNENRLSSSIKFTEEYIPKLIKIPAVREENAGSILFRNRNFGESKIKQLHDGKLQTGIYRNFYKSLENGRWNTIKK